MLTEESRVITRRGEIPVRDLSPGDLVLGHDGSVRPAWVPVERIRARHHRGRVVRMDTASGACLRMTAEHRAISRFVYTQQVHDLVLMELEGAGFTLGLANGQLRDVTESRFLYAPPRADASAPAGEESHEKAWLLLSMKDARRARFTARVLGLRYGLPALSLDPRLRAQEHPTAFIRRLQEKVDTRSRGRQLLELFGHRPDQPHFTMRRFDELSPGDPRLLVVDEFVDDGQSARTRNLVRIVPLRSARFQKDRLITPRPRQLPVQVVDTRAEVDALLDREERRKGTDVTRRTHVTALKSSFFDWTAAHLREACLVPACQGWGFENETIDRVTLDEFEGDVYGLVTADDRPISVGGLLVGGDDARATRALRGRAPASGVTPPAS